MISKVREKVRSELGSVADMECNRSEVTYDMGEIHEDIISLAFRYVPLKELRKLIVKGKQKIKELEELEEEEERIRNEEYEEDIRNGHKPLRGVKI
tara:strand:+ start:30 stop:317 length:288 start_codon:yes stop_codon:yes gene_type:complete